MLNNKKGITLIALIITIIIMLILVGVTVNVALNGGLFDTTKDASKQKEKSIIYDQVVSAMNVRNNGTINVKGTYEDAKETLTAQGKTIALVEPTSEAAISNDVKFTVTGKYGTFKYQITEAEIKIIEEIDGGEDTGGGGNPTPMPQVAVNEKATQNSTINGQEYSSTNPIIPAGFAPINITGAHQSSWSATNLEQEIKKGLVITDNTTTRDNNGNTIGNEFVWIPVSQSEFSSFAVLQEGSLTDYKGVLYDWENNSHMNVSQCNEPAVITMERGSFGSYVSGADAIPSNLELAGLPANSTSDDFKEQLQNEFNNMVESVFEYGGFYVGRYEASISSGEQIEVQSKAGELPMRTSWYEMYRDAKTYSNEGVTTGMVWGCQWDAMLRLIEQGPQRSHINEVGNVPHNQFVFNTKPYYTGGIDYSTNYTVKPGEEGYIAYNDIASNIYDLEGNEYECTMEAYSSYHRIGRGATYAGDPDKKMISRAAAKGTPLLQLPSYVSGYGGTRLTLYVEIPTEVDE